jgi:hypothetical protein
MQANASGLTPGSLVPSLPGAPDLSQVRLAYGDMIADAGSVDGNADQAGGMDVSQMLASIEQNRINMLKPTPAQARLAYLMLSMPSPSA